MTGHYYLVSWFDAESPQEPKGEIFRGESASDIALHVIYNVSIGPPHELTVSVLTPDAVPVPDDVERIDPGADYSWPTLHEGEV